jgi:ankyrin repeat protein
VLTESQLHYAAGACNIDTVRALVKAGTVDINQRDSNRDTALHHAVRYVRN